MYALVRKYNAHRDDRLYIFQNTLRQMKNVRPFGTPTTELIWLRERDDGETLEVFEEGYITHI